jgi:hypothetical protein
MSLPGDLEPLEAPIDQADCAGQDRFGLSRAERLAFIEEHRRDPNPPSTQGLEQACFDCGRWEAAGFYCSWCFLPMGPEDWYPWGSDTARRASARAAAAEKGHTPPKRPRGRPCRSVAQSEWNEAKSRLLGVSTRSGAGRGVRHNERTGPAAPQCGRSVEAPGKPAQVDPEKVA